MASIDAYNALMDSNLKWEKFRSNHIGMIDLKLAELKDADLEGKNLSSCDFSGADFENANLDRCKVHNSVFNNACLENASLVFSSVRSSIFDNTNMKRIVVRETQIKDVHFSNTSLKEAEFLNCKLHNCLFDKTDLHSIKLELIDSYGCKFNNIDSYNLNIINSEFIHCIFNNSIFNESLLKSLNFEDCSLRDFRLFSSKIDTVALVNSKIFKLDLSNTSLSCLNLSGSILTDVDLSQFDLPNTVFLNTAINNSVWPIQKGTTSVMGKYNINPNLLGQPVQDVKGLSPSLRREIADAQYLKEILKTNRFISKSLLRIWGLTTNYGQSLVRLTTISILTILLLSFIFVICDGNISAWPSNVKNGLNAIGYVSSSFIGFGINKNLIVSHGRELLLFITRIFGYFVLGLWIGVAANKLGKLSAE